jgi:glycogen debranching enzyme
LDFFLEYFSATTARPSSWAALISRRYTMSAPRSQNVYVLPLTDGGAPDVPGGYIYLPPPSKPAYIVRFSILGTSSICRNGSLWVNFPAEGEEFRRHKYKEYK